MCLRDGTRDRIAERFADLKCPGCGRYANCVCKTLPAPVAESPEPRHEEEDMSLNRENGDRSEPEAKPVGMEELVSEIKRQLALKSEVTAVGPPYVLLNGEHLLATIEAKDKEIARLKREDESMVARLHAQSARMAGLEEEIERWKGEYMSADGYRKIAEQERDEWREVADGLATVINDKTPEFHSLRAKLDKAREGLRRIDEDRSFVTDGSGSAEEFEALYDFWHDVAIARRRLARQTLAEIGEGE